MKRANRARTGSTSPQRSPQQNKKPRLDTASTVTTTGNLKAVNGNSFEVFTEGKSGPFVKDNVSGGPFGLAQEDAVDAGSWTKVEKGKKKKTKNTENKLTNNPPKFFYSSKEINSRKEPVGISDLRELIIHLIGDGPPQSWLKVENRNAIQKVVVAQIPGLTNSLLNLPPIPTDPTSNPNVPLSVPSLSTSTSQNVPQPASASQETSTAASPGLPFISKTFLHALPTRAPGEQMRMHSVLGSFFMGPVSGEEKRRRILARLDQEKQQHEEQKKQNKGGKNARRNWRKVVERYLLNAEEMTENEYPVPTYVGEVSQLGDGWVESTEAISEEEDGEEEEEEEEEEQRMDDMDVDNGKSEKEGKRAVYSLDCEMCMTEDGKELTRVCVVDAYTEKVILDELVKPVKPVTDYLTRFSGITESHLANVTTTLPIVQAKLLSLFTSQTILLGHSLEQDLRALKLAHPRCVDTALIYHHPRGRPLKPGLAWLTKKWCGRDIQTRGDSGHDPEEDAKACIDLLKKKLENGPSFGEFKIDQESILERLSRSTTRNIATAVVDYGNPSTWHGAKATMAIACKSDAEVLAGMLEAVPQCQFVFGRFLELSDALEWTTPKPDSPSALPVPDALNNLNSRLQTLYSALPLRTALVLFSGHSDPRPMAQLSQRKQKWENEIRMGKNPEGIPRDEAWTVQDGRQLEEVTALARRGLAFLCLKVEKG